MAMMRLSFPAKGHLPDRDEVYKDIVPLSGSLCSAHGRVFQSHAIAWGYISPLHRQIARHQRSRGRKDMAEVKEVKASAGQTVINEILERDGCAVIEDLLTTSEIAEVAAELAP